MSVPVSTAAAPGLRAENRLSVRAAALVAAPLLVLASELAAPREPDGLSDRAEAAFLVDHSQRLLVSGLFGLLAGTAQTAAFLVVALTPWERGRSALRVAAFPGIAGGVGLVMHMTALLAGRDILLDDPASYATVHALDSGTNTLIALLALVVGINLAMIVLAAGAKRAGLAGWWVVAAAVLGLVADFWDTSYNTIGWSLFATAVMVPVARGAAAAARRQHQGAAEARGVSYGRSARSGSR